MEFKGTQEELINSIQNYFISKIVKGEYEVTKREEFTWLVKIDSRQFCLWISNGSDNFRTYHAGGYNFMYLDFTIEQREKGWETINKLIKEYESTELIREKRKQFAQLKKELEELEN